MGRRVLSQHVQEVSLDILRLRAELPLQVNVPGLAVVGLRQRLQHNGSLQHIVVPVGRQAQPVQKPFPHIAGPHIVYRTVILAGQIAQSLVDRGRNIFHHPTPVHSAVSR